MPEEKPLSWPLPTIWDSPDEDDDNDFGHWIHNQSNNTLEYHDNEGRFLYYVDFDRCRTSAQVLDWIFQIHQKDWCSAQDMHDLLKAICYVIDPQANLCSFEMSKTLPKDFLTKRATRRKA